MITDFEQAYFLGIGGIGMSAIARYLLQIGMPVMGYDKTPTPLTEALRAEGAEITFDDAVAALPQRVTQNLKNTLFILTPAIPKNHPQWVWLQEQQATILKRKRSIGQHCPQWLLHCGGRHPWQNHHLYPGGPFAPYVQHQLHRIPRWYFVELRQQLYPQNRWR